tara:strand:+ start:3137 stop:3535 length:399 start_codon:yes stop_codon:yes gene_type:complete
VNSNYKQTNGANMTTLKDKSILAQQLIKKSLEDAGIKIKKHEFCNTEWLNGDLIYYGFFYVKSSIQHLDCRGNSRDFKTMVLPITVDNSGEIDLEVAPDDFIIGNLFDLEQDNTKTVEILKNFKSTDLEGGK